METSIKNKCKSFTSVEQSKQLAKILPIESADMAWCNNSIKGVNYTDQFSANLHTVKEMRDVFDKALRGWDKYWKLIPCWSLVALLEVLPKDIGRYTKSLYWFDETWHCEYVDEDSEGLCGASANNPIDACYEMILKLKERDLL